MELFQIETLIEKSQKMGEDYYEFLRVEDLSLGLYRLKAGQTDPQSPHEEDEIYYVVAGKGRVKVGEEVQSVQTGSIVYVPANAQHKFLDITEDLQLLVIFAPAES